MIFANQNPENLWGVNKTRNMEHSGTSRNIPEQGKLSQNKWKKKVKERFQEKAIKETTKKQTNKQTTEI